MNRLNRTKILVLPISAALLSSCGSAEEQVGAQELPLSVTASFQDGVNAYAGTSDTYIEQNNPTTNRGSAATCHADGDDGGGGDKSCLIRWNVSSIPAGSTVLSASITLQAVDATSNTYTIYAVNRSWTEAEATWQRATSATSWASPGVFGSDRGAAIGSLTGSGSRTVVLNQAGIAAVQAWVNGGTNAGVLIASSSATNGIDVASSEHGTVAYRPKLTVTYSDGAGGTKTSTDPNLLVAFIGDQGNSGNSDAVLQLIKAEGAHATVHNGDFDYADNPSAWNSRIDRILGSTYPYFAVVGNHDAAAWNGSSGYASYINARRARVPSMLCSGDLGVKANCTFRGLHIVQSCVGTSELAGHGNCSADSPEQVDFIRSSLADSGSIWSICAWHKNQHDMQVGGKTNEVGWNAYRECMNAGAIVTTGHEHSYARTLTLTDVGNRAAAHGKTGLFDQMQLGAGRNFVLVSGLAGVGIRDYEAASHDDDTWWASYYASNRWLKNGVQQPSPYASYGALFIRFNVGGDPKRAQGYFKDVNGRISDTFVIQAQ